MMTCKSAWWHLCTLKSVLIGLILSHSVSVCVGYFLSSITSSYSEPVCYIQWTGRWYCLLLLVKWCDRNLLLQWNTRIPARAQLKCCYCSSCNCNPYSSASSEGLYSNCMMERSMALNTIVEHQYLHLINVDSFGFKQCIYMSNCA